MNKPVPPPFAAAAMTVEIAGRPKLIPAKDIPFARKSEYESERDRAASAVISASMEKRLHGKTYPSDAVTDHDPHEDF